MTTEAARMGWDRDEITGEGPQWEACPECGSPTDKPDGGACATCATFDCPGECGRVIQVPQLACHVCAEWVRAEDDAALVEAAIAEGWALR